MSNIYFSVPDLKSKAVFSSEGPQPHYLVNSPKFKLLVIGLEAGQQLPVHANSAEMFHFLHGEGLMFVNDETFEIKPGATIVAQDGAKRGMTAKTRLIVLASKGE